MFLVTGGAGFIGSNIVAAIEERGLGKVAICDRLGSGGKRRNIEKRKLADIVEPERLFEFLGDNRPNIEAIIHMGAVSDTTASDASRIRDTNFRLPVALWNWCAGHRVRFLYASSAATYGDGAEGFDDDNAPEALARLKPLNLYARSKHLFDRRVVRMAADGGPRPPQWAGLKFFNVYGPNEDHKGGQKSVVAQIFPKAAAGEAARLFKSHHPDYADGGQLRDFIWVGDCVDVVLWFLEHDTQEGLFNCGTGRARSFADLAAAVYRALGKEPRIEYIPTPEAIRDRYQYFTEADMSRLRAAGYDQTFTTLEDGVGTYVKGFLNTDDRYR
jgi:ADP-L-glycero-D-manno-heptose 6-epimerase